jgi:hypothetical protein
LIHARDLIRTRLLGKGLRGVNCSGGLSNPKVKMLPEFLDSTYKKYKQDTSVFVEWLSENAQKCGWKTNNGTLYKLAPTVLTN